MTDDEVKKLLDITVETIRRGLIGADAPAHYLAIIGTDGGLAPLPWPDMPTAKMRSLALKILGRSLGPIYAGFKAVIYAGEMWYISKMLDPDLKKEDALKQAHEGLMPSKHPDRKEGIVVCILTKERQQIAALLDIKRKDGKIAALISNPLFGLQSVELYMLEAFLDGMEAR